VRDLREADPLVTDGSIRIADCRIGRGSRPFVVAEMSGNHNQSLDRALAIVEAAASAGVQGLKLQTYTPDTMTLDLNEREFHISDPKSLWAGKSLYALYGEAFTPWEWHAPILERARALGLVAFSTPFDASSVDFLEALDVPCYKIASFENTDLPLVRRVAATGKPLIISTGMATLDELAETVRAAREAGCRDLILLKCTSSYPASPEHTNLATIPDMRQRFACEVGLSDHTAGSGVAVASIALGATVIEKHMTLSREDGGVDSAFSQEPAEMARLVTEVNRAWDALGSISYGPTEAERASLQFRRSLYIVKDVKTGEVLSAEHVRAIRPGRGLPPKFIDQIVGRRAARDIARGTPLDWSLVR
jgi:pseudaminic acid synthase